MKFYRLLYTTCWTNRCLNFWIVINRSTFDTYLCCTLANARIVASDSDTVVFIICFCSTCPHLIPFSSPAPSSRSSSWSKKLQPWVSMLGLLLGLMIDPHKWVRAFLPWPLYKTRVTDLLILPSYWADLLSILGLMLRHAHTSSGGTLVDRT